MNPSSSGWIDKFIFILEKENDPFPRTLEVDFYTQLVQSGFIYGCSVKPVVNKPISELQLTEEELAKVNLIYTLFYQYHIFTNSFDYTQCLKSIVDFYESLSFKKSGSKQSKLTKHTDSKKIEKFLSSRIEKNIFLEKTTSNTLLINALLFLDVICFKHYLEGKKNIDTLFTVFENSILHTCFLALLAKKQKAKNDILLIEMFKNSHHFRQNNLNFSENINSHLNTIFSKEIEKLYLIDLCSLAIWNDNKIDHQEISFILSITRQLDMPEESALNAFHSIKSFADKNSTIMQLFKHSDPVSMFYKQSVTTVKHLILRNKNRLIKELSQSRELVLLLSKSTVTELDASEKNKVKNQLIELCKTIPSLTIFLLPGGTLLLPLLIKFIPQLLPRAFDENKIPKN